MKSISKSMATAVCFFLWSIFFSHVAFSESLSIEKSLSYRFSQYFSNKDLDGMASLFNDNITVYDPGKVTKGKGNFLDLLKGNFDKTKRIVFRPLHVYQDGDTTVLEFTLSFDQDVYNGVDIFVWKNNKIEEIRCYYYAVEPAKK